MKLDTGKFQNVVVAPGKKKKKEKRELEEEKGVAPRE